MILKKFLVECIFYSLQITDIPKKSTDISTLLLQLQITYNFEHIDAVYLFALAYSSDERKLIPAIRSIPVYIQFCFVANLRFANQLICKKSTDTQTQALVNRSNIQKVYGDRTCYEQ